MKKLILSILLFTVINCSGQVSLKGFTRTCGKDSVFSLLTTTSVSKLPPYMMNIPAIDVTKVIKDTLGVRPIIDLPTATSGSYYSSPMNNKSFLIKPAKLSFHIDSTYLQLIIQELERHGYTLVKLPKKQ